MKKYLAVILSAAIVAGMLAGCGGSKTTSGSSSNSTAASSTSSGSGDSSTAKGGKIAYITNDTINDGGWNQSLYNAMEEASKKYGLETAYTENVAEADYVTTFSNYANMGFDMIFAPGNEYTDAVVEVAPTCPNCKFILFNGTVSGDNYISIKADNIQVGFMAGVVAGLKTVTNSIAYVGAIEMTTAVDQISGFKQGAAYVKDGIDVSVGYTGDFSDTAKAKETAISLITSKNCDAFFAGASSVDIGVREGLAGYTDRFGIAQPADSLDENPDVVLTSVITDNVKLIDLAINDWSTGKFGNQVYEAGAAEDALYYGRFGNNAKAIESQVNEIYTKLKAGEIKLVRNE